MEQKTAPYIVAVAPEPREYTITDLLRLKAAYIEQGKDSFDDLALIVSVFGSEVRIERTKYRVWQRGHITALYTLKTGHYIEREKRFAETEVLSIFLDLRGLEGLKNPDRIQVAYLRKGDEEVESEQKFIPGRWLADMLSEYTQARAKAVEIDAEMKAADRDDLIEELMIGKDI